MKHGGIKKRLSAFLLNIIILAGLCPSTAVFASESENAKKLEKKLEREVYLHALSSPSLTESTNKTTVYMGEDAEIFFAVDVPNKGEYISADDEAVKAAAKQAKELALKRAESMGLTGEDAESFAAAEEAKARESARHTSPQFDLQGYKVKISYDTRYFKPVNENLNEIMDYTVPNDDKNFSIPDDDDIIENNEAVLNPGYMLHMPEHFVPASDSGETRAYVKATIFIMDTGYFPYSGANNDKWYNLCMLALTPIRTGYTYLRLECDTEDDLKLFAKNNSDADALRFNTTVKNDGCFYLTIEDRDKPSAPYPDSDHPAGIYNEEIEISLRHDNKEKGEIYFTLDGVSPKKDTASRRIFAEGDTIDISSNTTVKTAFLREDGKWSDVKDYEYTFLPRKPYLFNSRGELIPTAYTEVYSNDGYFVNASDTMTSGELSTATTIYYTYNENVTKDDIKTDSEAVSPRTGWAKAGREGQIHEAVTGDVKIRLCAVNNLGKSEISEYFLGIKPGNVSASPDSGLDKGRTITLLCATPNSDIYYTADGSDPRAAGAVPYSEPIELKGNSVIKAAARYGGKWGEVSSFWYVFSDNSESGVLAYHPSGVYTGSVDVMLYPAESGKKIEISYDGGRTFSDYGGEVFTLTEYTKFRARIKGGEADDSGEEFLYVIKPENPIFSPESTQFNGTGTVTVFSPELIYGRELEGYELRYTTDGRAPEKSDAAEGLSVNITVNDAVTVKAVIVNGDGWASDVVEHSYGVVYNRPQKPTVTLKPGFYTREIGSDEFYTEFENVPSETEIYYTVGTGDGKFTQDPDIREVGKDGAKTFLYKKGDKINIIDTMTVKAVAVRKINGVDIQSDVACFYYRVTPSAPKATASVAAKKLPVIAVDALTVEKSDDNRCTVNYIIGNDDEGFIEQSFSNDTNAEGKDFSVFYIDTATGSAYRAYKDGKLADPIFESDKCFSQKVILRLSEELDGVLSAENAYIYAADEEADELLPPIADKESGTYEEDKSGFLVKLYPQCGNDNAVIEWRFDTDDEWKLFSEEAPCVTKFDNAVKILYARARDEKNAAEISSEAAYLYYFVPPAPSITPESGVYKKSDNVEISISRSEKTPEEGRYRLYYMQSTEEGWNYRTSDFSGYRANESKTVKAYVKNENTGKISDVVYKAYVVTDDTKLGAAVSIEYPFSKHCISAHRLGTGDYAKGILFTPSEGVSYEYSYNLTEEAGGGSYDSGVVSFNKNTPLIPTYLIKDLSITYWIDGNKEETKREHNIEFVHLDIPKTTLEADEKPDYFKKNEEYHVLNAYHSSDERVVLYYTTDGSNPTNENSKRTAVRFGEEKGPEEKLKNSKTVVRAVYFVACGSDDCTECASGNFERCKNSEYTDYGEEGIYTYLLKSESSSGGGGGGGTVTYKLTFEANGGTSVDAVSRARNTVVDLSGYTTTKSGYDFDGWYTDKELTKRAAEIKMTENTTVYAKWIENESGSTAKPSYRPDIFTKEHYAYIVGRDGGYFCPDADLTRAEAAEMLYRLLSGEVRTEARTTENGFADVNESDWFNVSVSTLAGLGAIRGRTSEIFAPNEKITRAEFATIMVRISDMEIRYDGEDLFADIATHWAREYINRAASVDWVIGYDGYFRPDYSITRAEVVTLINRVLKRQPEGKTDLLHNMLTPPDNTDENVWYYLAVQEAVNNHDYELKEDGVHEKWTSLTENPDWTNFEN